MFNGGFGGVVELVAIGGEEFDAVVVVGIMGGANHAAGAGLVGVGEVGDRRGGEDARS